MATKANTSVRFRIRVFRGKEITFGPGKAELLTHLARTGSLNQAAKRMNMSYMKAWSMVKLMNQSYKQPLVKAERGGSGGGGAELTDFGRRLLSLYAEMEKESLSAVGKPWKEIQKMLK
ncbi:MAG: LysR family transcriptional regulator [Chthoniobacterales bacterium]